ncbi:hypothetical protein CCUS01_04254 [Colletotrichum cuscutae]|uniref:Uncharacterized protein n=1 Tax=Colletotrichum cuscutae TaxID=1209917 RepID=A0AAI9VDT5_9PEZI|nr:hypothetical protein CCUS01_04254 [Colletotrichum cuscutae]
MAQGVMKAVRRQREEERSVRKNMDLEDCNAMTNGNRRRTGTCPQGNGPMANPGRTRYLVTLMNSLASNGGRIGRSLVQHYGTKLYCLGTLLTPPFLYGASYVPKAREVNDLEPALILALHVYIYHRLGACVLAVWEQHFSLAKLR